MFFSISFFILVNVAGALMHSINVDLLNQDECRERLQNAESQLNIDDSLVCGKPQLVSNNMCQVDVGGPLACDRGDGFYELTGIYSQETGCLPTNQVRICPLIKFIYYSIITSIQHFVLFFVSHSSNRNNFTSKKRTL